MTWQEYESRPVLGSNTPSPINLCFLVLSCRKNFSYLASSSEMTSAAFESIFSQYSISMLCYIFVYYQISFFHSDLITAQFKTSNPPNKSLGVWQIFRLLASGANAFIWRIQYSKGSISSESSGTSIPLLIKSYFYNIYIIKVDLLFCLHTQRFK